MGPARDVAETFRYEAQNAARLPETVAALRYLGLTSFARGTLWRRGPSRGGAEDIRPGPRPEANFRFGTDSLSQCDDLPRFSLLAIGRFQKGERTQRRSYRAGVRVCS